MPTTAWVKAPKKITGQDHLGTIAACEMIYSQLLPGITNVTPRARAYAFYSWLAWSIDQLGLPKDRTSQINLLRRAECLWCLIAIHHENGTADSWAHGATLAGRDALVPAWRDMGTATTTLSRFATTDDGPDRYFKGILGGLGQYYVGTLRNLHILTWEEPEGIKYDRQRATTLAQAFNAGVDAQRFFRAIRTDSISRQTLTQLQSFCPCRLPANTAEQAALCNLFFNETVAFQDPAQAVRRKTLLMLLDLVHSCATLQPTAVDVGTVRAAIYAGALPGGHPWNLPDALAETRRRWAVYQRMDMLSMAMQTIFWVVLVALEESGIHPPTSLAAARWMFETPGPLGGVPNLAERFPRAIERRRQRLPAITDTENRQHEMARYFELATLAGDRTQLGLAFKAALDVLLGLIARDVTDAPIYEDLTVDAEFAQMHPINLEQLRQHARGPWQAYTMRQVLESLLARWVLEGHFTVALRKLRYERMDTFRIHPGEDGLTVVEPWPPAYSTPRLFAALQILRDLGAVQVDAATGTSSLTPVGQSLRARSADG